MSNKRNELQVQNEYVLQLSNSRPDESEGMRSSDKNSGSENIEEAKNQLNIEDNEIVNLSEMKKIYNEIDNSTIKNMKMKHLPQLNQLGKEISKVITTGIKNVMFIRRLSFLLKGV
jgi:hypothetical protein